jgi:hypothetical protein
VQYEFFSTFPQTELTTLAVKHMVDETRRHPAYRF